MFRIIENQFRHPAGLLGKIVSIFIRKISSTAYDKLIDKLELKPEDNIFEIGYGHGLGIKKILCKYDCFISGIDFSELMHKEATKRNKKFIDSKKAALYYGDFLNYDLKPNMYDKIFCLNVIYFWNNLKVPFLKIRQGLNNNGIFCLYMDTPDELSRQGFSKEDIFNKYSVEQVIDQLNLSGFKEIDYQYENGYYIKCKK